MRMLFPLLVMLLAAAACADAPTPAPPEPAPSAAREEAEAAAPVRAQPAVRMWHELVYDDERRTVLLVNGSSDRGTPASDTVELWTWNGTDWQLVSADGPPWRNLAAATFDTRRNVLVVYGGSRGEVGEAGYVQLAETWEWDGTRWTQHEVPGPGPREGHGLTFDPERGVVVLFGGNSNGQMRGDTWTWDGRAWKNAATTGPQARFPALFAYDGASRTVLLFGGHAIDPRGFATFDDTWAWDGTHWQKLDRPGPFGTRRRAVGLRRGEGADRRIRRVPDEAGSPEHGGHLALGRHEMDAERRARPGRTEPPRHGLRPRPPADSPLRRLQPAQLTGPPRPLGVGRHRVDLQGRLSRV